MSVDKLQNRIRKLKNPSMVLFSLDGSQIPPLYLDAASGVMQAYHQYAGDLLEALKDIVPSVRFDFASFALAGTEGLEILAQLLDAAACREYYVLLDTPAAYSPQGAALAADALLQNWQFDALLLNCYLGSDGIKPFMQGDKDLFLALRTGNRSASEIQDLLTGTRLVYTVAADMAKRLGEDQIDRCGYSRIAGVGPATSAEALQLLRSKYPALFLLVDGFDYSGANAKNCSLAFDKLGHGAVVCASNSVLGAWQDAYGDAMEAVIQAAERMKKNLTRYVGIL